MAIINRAGKLDFWSPRGERMEEMSTDVLHDVAVIHTYSEQYGERERGSAAFLELIPAKKKVIYIEEKERERPLLTDALHRSRRYIYVDEEE